MKISTVLSVTVLFLLPYLAESSALSVKTSNGLVVGHRASNRTHVFEYIGIPFAQPPVDSLRFAPPEKYQCSANSRVLLAAKYVGLPILKMSFGRHTDLHTLEAKVKSQAFVFEAFDAKESQRLSSKSIKICHLSTGNPSRAPNCGQLRQSEW
jgi:hypothetical protein